MHNKTAIVVGSGIAGMATAIRLSAMGYAVTVFEKNTYPGGKLSAFVQDGFQFDAGPSLFTQPYLLEALFESAGKQLSNYFSYTKMPYTCHYFFANGKEIVADADVEKFAVDAERILDEPVQNTLSYLKKSGALYNSAGDLFLNYSLHKWKSFIGKPMWNALKSAKAKYFFQTLDTYNCLAFETPEMAQLFNRYATYNGSNPYTAPAMLSIIPHVEMNEGSYYAHGGMISITNAMHILAVELGVQFVFDAQVTAVMQQNNSATGVMVQGEPVLSDLVVCNNDVYFAKNFLLNNTVGAQKILEQERSSSAFIFYWGISKTFPQLGLHNIFFAQDYALEFAHIFKHKTCGNDVTVYINITQKMDTSHAPNGCENWFVMVNAPTDIGQDWAAWQTELKAIVIRKLSHHLKVNIAEYIISESVLTPAGIAQKTGSYQGSLYGTSSNSIWAAFLRHPNFSSKLKQLYFVGGSVHPGGGIPLCLRSAAIMTNLVGK